MEARKKVEFEMDCRIELGRALSTAMLLVQILDFRLFMPQQSLKDYRVVMRRWSKTRKPKNQLTSKDEKV
jgi:hypothetical protein